MNEGSDGSNDDTPGGHSYRDRRKIGTGDTSTAPRLRTGIRESRLLLQNPYAYIEDLEEGMEQPFIESTIAAADDSRFVSTPRPVTASKKDFQARCRRIFADYNPSRPRDRLRQEYRDFIVRNESRPARDRAQILAQLQRYDLSSTPGLQPQFNREYDSSLDAKLRALESSIDSDESTESNDQ